VELLSSYQLQYLETYVFKAMTDSTPDPRFWNYPAPKEGPDVPARYEASSNPVLRGFPLAIAATMYVVKLAL
jgi:hypothetical protein